MPRSAPLPWAGCLPQDPLRACSLPRVYYFLLLPVWLCGNLVRHIPMLCSLLLHQAPLPHGEVGRVGTASLAGLEAAALLYEGAACDSFAQTQDMTAPVVCTQRGCSLNGKSQ